jgi:hypothetical protein
MANFTTVFVKGKLYWSKLERPVDNYEKTGREWTVDFVPDDVTFLKEHRLLDRLKEGRAPIEGDYIRLRKPEKDKDGNKNEPIKVIDSDNQPWEHGVNIGNGSDADVKLTIADFGAGKKKAIWAKAIRVTTLVPYEVDEFGGMEETPRKKADTKGKGKKTEELDLDDDIPF